MSAQELAPVVRPPQGSLPTRVREHSRPSLQSSPLPSPHPHSSSHSSPHHPHSTNNSPPSTYFPFPPHMPSEDLQQQHVQAQLPPQHHSSHQNLLSMPELDWPLAQNYNYPMDAATSAQNWDQSTTTMQSQHHPSPDTIPRFSSSQPPSSTRASQQPSPPLQQALSRHPPSTHVSDHSEDLTAHTMMRATTDQNQDLNLDDCQSWSSAMTMADQIQHLGHFYYPAQAHQPQAVFEQALRARTRHPAHLSRPLRPSPLSILSPPPQQGAATLHYSQELLRQQEAQLRQAEAHAAIQAQVEAGARVRRNSDEANYLHHHQHQHHPFASTYPSQRQFYIPGQEQVEQQLSPGPPHFPQHRHPLHQLDPGHPMSVPLPQATQREMQFLLQRQHPYPVEAMEQATANMIRFESQSHHTPPLLLE